MRSNGALDWNDFIGERPIPPTVTPETDKARLHDSLLINVISLSLSASIDVLKEAEAVLVKGCDLV